MRSPSAPQEARLGCVAREATPDTSISGYLMPNQKRWAAVFVVLALAAGSPAPAQQNPAGSDAEAAFNAGLLHLREGRPAIAVDEFKRAVKLDPKNPYAHKGLGLAYLQQQMFDLAAAELRRALELNPYFVDVRNDLGTALVLGGRREEGKKEFLAAFNDPTNPTPEFAAANLGRAYFEDRNFPEAINWFRTAVARNKNFGDAVLGLADALTAQGKLEEAIVQLEAALREKDNAENAAVLLRLGEAYRQAGRLAEAKARYEEAARKDPASPAGRRAAELLRGMPTQ